MTAARAELTVVGEGRDWIAWRSPGASRVVKLRRLHAHAQDWVQMLVAVTPERNARQALLLRASAQLVLGAPAIDEQTVVLREALSLRSATWPGIKELVALLQVEAGKLAATLRAPAGESSYAMNFAE